MPGMVGMTFLVAASVPSSVSELGGDSAPSQWLVWTLMGLVVLGGGVSAVIWWRLGSTVGRPHPSLPGPTVDDWNALASGDLPEDPADALAELARRADDETE